MLKRLSAKGCHRQLKLMLSMASCVVIIIAAEYAKLPTVFALSSLSIGLLTYLGYVLLQTRFTRKATQAERISYAFASFLLVVEWAFLPKSDLIISNIALFLQCLGFALIGLIILAKDRDLNQP